MKKLAIIQDGKATIVTVTSGSMVSPQSFIDRNETTWISISYILRNQLERAAELLENYGIEAVYEVSE